jgi:hypothetical protein
MLAFAFSVILLTSLIGRNMRPAGT